MTATRHHCPNNSPDWVIALFLALTPCYVVRSVREVLAARLPIQSRVAQQKNTPQKPFKEKLMNVQRSIFASVGIAVLFATASFGEQVKTDYDRSANFSQYKTYSWQKVQTQDQLWVSRIEDAVNAALTAKGLTQVPSGGQLAIVAIEMTKNQQTLNTFYDGFGGGWGWRRFGGGGLGDATTTTENYKVGTLVVDLFDANSKQLIWRGSASDTLSDKSEKNIKNLDKGVQKMFDHFPPGANK
jgi:Domain of unknown function (DUF4136)